MRNFVAILFSLLALVPTLSLLMLVNQEKRRVLSGAPGRVTASEVRHLEEVVEDLGGKLRSGIDLHACVVRLLSRKLAFFSLGVGVGFALGGVAMVARYF